MTNDLSRDLKVNIKVANTGLDAAALDALAKSITDIGKAFTAIGSVGDGVASSLNSAFSVLTKAATPIQQTTSAVNKLKASFNNELTVGIKAATTSVNKFVGDSKAIEDTERLIAGVTKSYSKLALTIDTTTLYTKKLTAAENESAAHIITLKKRTEDYYKSKAAASAAASQQATIEAQTRKDSLSLVAAEVAAEKQKATIDAQQAATAARLAKLDKERAAQIAVLTQRTMAYHQATNAANTADRNRVALAEQSKNYNRSIELDKTNAALQRMSTSLKKVTIDEAKFQAIIGKSSSITDVANAATKRGVDWLNKYNLALLRSNKTVNAYASSLQELANRFKTVATFRAISTVLQYVNTAFSEGITAMVDYSQALKDLQSITRATDEDVSLMGDAIKETSSNTKFLVTEVAAGMKLLSQAGLSAAEATTVINDVALLATGTLSDMASSADLVTTTMRVFNIEATESGRIVDAFANSVNRSKLTIDKIRTAFNYVGPVAKAAGVGFEETQAALAALANSGLRASTIGTGLRRILSELADPTAKFSAAAKDAGVSLDLLNPNTNDFSDVLSSLKLVLTDSAVAFDIFGKRGAAAALALTSETSGYQDLLDVISESGTTAEMAEIQMQGLGVAFKKVIGKIQLFVVAIGEAGLIDILYKLAIGFQVVIDALTKFINTDIGKLTVMTVAFVGFVTALILTGKAFIFTTTAMVGAAAQAAITTGAVSTLSGAFQILRTSIISYAVAQNATAVSTTSGIVALKGLTLAAWEATVALVAAAAAAVGLTVIPFIAIITAVAAAVLALGAAYIYTTKHSLKSAKANQKLVDTYKQLGEASDGYAETLESASDSSATFDTAARSIISSLEESADKHAELSIEAEAAADSIDLLEGAVTDGGVALQDYNDKLDTLETKAAIKASRDMENAIRDQTGSLATLGLETTGVFRQLGNAVLRAYHIVERDSIATLSDWVAARLGLVVTAVDTTNKKIRDLEGANILENELQDMFDQIHDGTIDWKKFEVAAKTAGEAISDGIATNEQIKAHQIYQDETKATKARLEELTKKGGYDIQLSGDDLVERLVEMKLLEDADSAAAASAIRYHEKRQELDAENLNKFKANIEDRVAILSAGTSSDIEANNPISKFIESLDATAVESIDKVTQDVIKALGDFNTAIDESKAATLTFNADPSTSNLDALIAAELKVNETKTALNKAYNATALDINASHLYNLTKQQQDAAVKIAAIKNKYSISGGKQTAKIAADSAKKIQALDKATAEKRIALAVAYAKTNKQNESIAKTKRQTKATALLEQAKQKDFEISKDNAELGAAGLSVSTAKLKNYNTEIVALSEYIKTQKTKLAIIEKQHNFDVDKLEADKAYQKILKDVNITQGTLNKVTAKSLSLKRKEYDLVVTADDAWKSYNEALKETAEIQADLDFDAELDQIERNGGSALDIIEKKIAAEDRYRLKKLETLSIQEGSVSTDIKKTKADTKTAEDTGDTDTQQVLRKQLADQLLLLQEYKQARIVLEAEGDAAVYENKTRLLEASLRDLKNSHNSKKITTETYYNALLDLQSKHSGVDLKLVLAAEVKLNQEMLDAKLISWEEYYSNKAELRDRGAVVGKDTLQDEINNTNSLFDAFKKGASDSVGETKTLKEEVYDLGDVAAESISSGLTENITAFADGTKSASEAFSDFIKGLLADIAKAILQALILQAIQSAFGNGGEVNKADGGAVSKADGGWAGYSYADGGVAGVQGGGMIRGYSPHHKADNIKANLTAGEYVIPVRSVERLREGGDWVLESLRRGILPTAQYATGGLVKGISSLGNITNSLPNYNLGGIVRAQSFTPSFADGGMVQTNDVNVAAPNVNVQPQEVSIVNVSDTDAANKGWLDSVKGEKTLINFMSKNRTAIAGVLR